VLKSEGMSVLVSSMQSIVQLLPPESLSAPFSAPLTGASFLALLCSTSNDLGSFVSYSFFHRGDRIRQIAYRVLNAGGRTSDGSTDL